MKILIRIYLDPLVDAPLNPEELIVCDEGGNIIYFENNERAEAYREKKGISSQIYSLD